MTGSTTSRRASSAANPAAAKRTSAEPPQIQRAPKASVSGPAASIARPRTTKFVLMITVKARPRSRSGALRWTSVMLATTATPLPSPETTIAAAATQMLGATAAMPTPVAKTRIPSG